MSDKPFHGGRGPGRQAASPRARRAMAEAGIEPSAVRGSGPAGRIVEADVRNAGANARRTGGEGRYEPASPMRLAIARRTAESFATIPHFYLRTEVDATALVELRAQIVEQVERDRSVRLTLTDFLLTAMGRALRDCPWANRVWRDEGLLEFPAVDVGLIIAVADGLLAPVVRRAGERSLVEMAKERSRLVEAARSGRLPADAVGGAASSLSNLGDGPVDEFGAVIMPPQSSMLSAGRAAPRPFVVNGRLRVRTTVHLCLSADHRVLDGAVAAAYLGRIVQLLERPALLMNL